MLEQICVVLDRHELRLGQRCERTDQPRGIIVILLLQFVCKAAKFVEADARVAGVDWREKVALDDLLAREEQDTIAPLLADVAAVEFEIDVPSEGSLRVMKQVVLVRVLVEEKLRVVHLPGEDEIVEFDALVDLPVLQAVHLGNVQLVSLRSVRVDNLGPWICFIPAGPCNFLQIVLNHRVCFRSIHSALSCLRLSGELRTPLFGTYSSPAG